MKKVLLTSAVALAAFGAAQAVSADQYVRTEPGIRYGNEAFVNPNAVVRTGVDKNGNEIGSRVPAQQKKAAVHVDKSGVRYTAATIEKDSNGQYHIVDKNQNPVPADAEFVGWEYLVVYNDNTTSTSFVPEAKTAGKYAETPARNPYDVRHRIGKDGKPLPEVFENGTHVRIHVKDQLGKPVSGVQVAALIYKSKADYEAGEPAINSVGANPNTIMGVSDASGDVEFPISEGGYVLFRVDTAPRGYFIPQKLVKGTELDAEEVTQDGKTMFVNGELVVEKTDSYNVVRTEWVKDDNGVWYYYEDNKQVTGWKQIDENWYYLNEKGEMQTGWVNVGGTWYYLNKSGVMQTGWVNVGGTWYFLEASGAMKASQWFQVKDKWYYVNASGALAVNTTVGGYTVNGNGEWVN